MPRLKVATLFSLATLLAVPLLAEGANPARPGTLNYIEGNASIDGRALTSHSVGKAEIEAGGTPNNDGLDIPESLRREPAR